MLRLVAGCLVAEIGIVASAGAQNETPGGVDYLTKAATWNSPAFLASWTPAPDSQGPVCREFRGAGELFGLKPQVIEGWFEKGRLVSISIIFLDSGAWFGYVPDAEARTVAQTKGPAFVALYKQTAATVSAGMEKLAGNKGREMTVGQEQLKQAVRVFHHGDLASRLTLVQDQLVKLSVFPDEESAAQLLIPERRGMKKDQTARVFAGQVQTLPNGDRLIATVPIIPQGDRAYCGVSTLAMVMRYMGVSLDTEDYAAAAGIHFGSTVKSRIKETYDAAGEAAEAHFPKTTRFDFLKAKASVDAGLPSIVFRRWSQ